jgi:hypothetical protein
MENEKDYAKDEDRAKNMILKYSHLLRESV